MAKPPFLLETDVYPQENSLHGAFCLIFNTAEMILLVSYFMSVSPKADCIPVRRIVLGTEQVSNNIY